MEDLDVGRDAALPEGAVSTESGVVLGALEEDVAVHWAIPYAAPPVGARRFAPPAPVTRSSTPIAGDEPPPACPQRSRAGDFIGVEDCLFLNVFSARAPGPPRPVMVWTQIKRAHIHMSPIAVGPTGAGHIQHGFDKIDAGYFEPFGNEPARNRL
ncbi:MAG: carboxylesterase family protein, partial [Myxococcota bacterium]